jgi:hypothetical protein
VGAVRGAAVYFAVADVNPVPLEEEPSEQVADAEEDEDHDRDHGRDQAHHREQFGTGATRAIHGGILAQSGADQAARGRDCIVGAGDEQQALGLRGGQLPSPPQGKVQPRLDLSGQPDLGADPSQLRRGP